jgi:hypothetical protein
MLDRGCLWELSAFGTCVETAWSWETSRRENVGPTPAGIKSLWNISRDGESFGNM